MTATAQIVTKQSLDKLIIPNSALRFKPKIQSEAKFKYYEFCTPTTFPQGENRPKEMGKKSL